MKNGEKNLILVLVIVLCFSNLIPAYATSSYTVKSGDVLCRIAKEYGLTYQEIAKVNNLADPNKILAGQNLIIPDNPVEPGETAGQGPGSSKPGEKVLDTPEVIAELDKARNLAGDDKSLINTQILQSRDVDENGVPSGPPGPNLNPGEEEYAQPTKLFDNLYYVGGTEVGCLIFTTSEGYIMIDSGYYYMTEDCIIPGMKELGLDPAQVKYILITHAGPDHIGGASYFEKNYGTQIVMSKEEFDKLPKDGSKLFGTITPPEHAIVGTDGQKLTLGDTTITILETPRQKDGGGLTYIAPVYDNGERHTWITFGNTGIVGNLEDKALYRDSVAKVLKYVDEYKIDVVISNHPFVDLSLEKMEELRNRKQGEPNPFVFGQERVERFFQVLDQCCKVFIAREEAGLDETGSILLDPSAPKAGEPGATAGQRPVVSLDTPQIKAELQKAIDLAGDDKALIQTQRQQCKTINMSNVEQVPIDPIKLFDNLYFIGNEQVGCFLFTTTDGYIMIDSMRKDDPEKTIIPSMEKLGLDPAKIKYILITHFAPDHAGGVPYFQEKYGTHVVMSQEEWDDASSQNSGITWEVPDKDMVSTDGQKLTLGDTTITMVKTPRKVNGGGTSYIAPVFDHGVPHMFATYGNTNVVGTLEDKAAYREAVARFISYADEANVDVVISDHPFVDGSVEFMEQLRNRKEGEPNPFVWGQEKAKRFFKILDQSAVVLTLRQEAGLDETGTKKLIN